MLYLLKMIYIYLVLIFLLGNLNVFLKVIYYIKVLLLCVILNMEFKICVLYVIIKY